MRRAQARGREIRGRAALLIPGRATTRANGHRPPSRAHVVQILLVAGLYFGSARFGLRLSLVEKNVTPLWPPTGIALVAFLVFGRRIWPGVALAAFLVNVPISVNALAALATAAGNTLAPFVAAELLHLVGFRTELNRVRDAIAIVFLAALLSMLISASIGTSVLVLSGKVLGRDFLSAWAVWWTGDAMGVLVVAPFLLSLLHLRGASKASWGRRAEAAALLVILGAVTVTVMHTGVVNLKFLVFPFLGWAAWRFQQRGSAPAALLVAVVATWAAANGWGPFDGRTLFQKMLTLQAFNATVALTSFFLAALVTERTRAREGLERAAAELEDRVRRRTLQLSDANEQLLQEVHERKRIERRLLQQGRQLEEAQHMARIGSWEWLVDEDRVTWSDEMYRIHGYPPRAFAVTFARAMELIVPEDVARIRANLESAFESGREGNLPGLEYRIVRADGTERVLRGTARMRVRPARRMVGTVQDITEEKLAEREHSIAETLQRSLLPGELPDVPGVLLASRYVPASADVEVGGDWYDVVQLPDRRLGIAIGDIAGHGLPAATAMGQLRMALRAYALEEGSPSTVVRRVDQLVQRLMPREMATLIYLMFDPGSGMVRLTNAGHPPPLLLAGDGEVSYVTGDLAPPLGAILTPRRFTEFTLSLPEGSTLLLFTDGLVERRGVSIDDGFARLAEAAREPGPDLDAWCDRLLASLVGDRPADDVAMLALRPVGLGEGPLHLRLPAEPQVLAPMRETVRRWLQSAGAGDQDRFAVLVACSEACANAIVHAYGAGSGEVGVDLAARGDAVEVTVRDWGTWRARDPDSNAGRGLHMIQGFMDDADVQTGPEGTLVVMRRRLRGGSP